MIAERVNVINEIVRLIKETIEDMKKTIIDDDECSYEMKANARSYNRGLKMALEIIDQEEWQECSICRSTHISDDRHPCE